MTNDEGTAGAISYTQKQNPLLSNGKKTVLEHAKAYTQKEQNEKDEGTAAAAAAAQTNTIVVYLTADANNKINM